MKYPDNSSEEIEESLNILDLAIRLQIGFREGFINMDCFTKEMGINRDTHSTLKVKTDNRQPILKNRFHNLVLSSIGMVSCTVDSSLDEKFGSKNPSDHSHIGSLRSIMYMIRCAFAHDPCNPKWLCKGKYTNSSYEISINKFDSKRIIFSENSEEYFNFKFDFEKLNSCELNFEHFNALDGFFLLAEHAQKLVSE